MGLWDSNCSSTTRCICLPTTVGAIHETGALEVAGANFLQGTASLVCSLGAAGWLLFAHVLDMAHNHILQELADEELAQQLADDECGENGSGSGNGGGQGDSRRPYHWRRDPVGV